MIVQHDDLRAALLSGTANVRASMREMSDQFEGGSMLARADGSEVGMISWGVAEG